MRQVTARCDCTAATMCRDVRGGLLTLPCMKVTPVMPGVSDTDRAWSVMMTRKGPETLRSCGLVTSGQAPSLSDARQEGMLRLRLTPCRTLHPSHEFQMVPSF